MEVKKKKNEWSFKITNRDKIYWSIIAVLLATIIVLAIVLPRPYRVVEVEKQVVEYVYRDVHRENYYIISKENPLYNDGDSSVDVEGQEYSVLERYSLIDCGTFKSAIFVVQLTNNNQVISTIEQAIDETLINEFVNDIGSASMGVDIIISSENMKSLTDAWKENLPFQYQQLSYMFKFEFQKAVVQIAVDYVE